MITKKYLSKNQCFVPGIYGGMGPMAHIKFEEALIRECIKRGIKTDQEYPVWLVTNGSSTPDRTKSLASGNNSALRHLIYFAKHLEKQGADFIIMTCNTAHAYEKYIEKHLSIPIISLIEETAKNIYQNYTYKKVGVLATDGTLNAKLYQNALTAVGITSVTPDVGSDVQKCVMNAIYDPSYGIKSTGTQVSEQALKNLDQAVSWCLNEGAQIIVAGCTELSIGLADKRYKNIQIVDPMNVLAQRTFDLSFKPTEAQNTFKNLNKQRSTVVYQKYEVLSQ